MFNLATIARFKLPKEGFSGDSVAHKVLNAAHRERLKTERRHAAQGMKKEDKTK